MSKLFKTATMAIAASGLAFAMPASAAPALHANPNAHAAVTGDMTFETATTAIIAAATIVTVTIAATSRAPITWVMTAITASPFVRTPASGAVTTTVIIAAATMAPRVCWSVLA